MTFVADTVPDNARHIEELLERAKVADARVARNREGAHPAGDPDPYRPGPDGDGGYHLGQSPDGADHEAGYSAS